MTTRMLFGFMLQGAILVASPASARIVGFREPVEGASLAIRGMVVAGTTVTGVRFFSNDATVFPEVLLATDAGEEVVPRPDAALRSVPNVVGSPGYVVVTFEPYTLPATAHLWAIIRLPDNQPCRSDGLRGGPGVGLRSEPAGLFLERSIYRAAGGHGEFGEFGQFDISLLTTPAPFGKATPRQAEPEPVLLVGSRPNRTGPGATIALSIPRAARTTVDVYDIAGRHVIRLLDAALLAGFQEIVWRAEDGRQRPVASGVYLYRVQVGEERRSGKMVILR